VEIPKNSIAKYETALQDGRNPADRPRDGPQKYSRQSTSSRVCTLHLAEAVAAIGSIQDAEDKSCHRARTIEPRNSITLLPMPHAAAATAHGKGDHLTAHELSKQAHEHSMNAHKLAEELGAKAASSSKAKGGMPELRADLNPPH
jgi:hypothetical protein